MTHALAARGPIGAVGMQILAGVLTYAARDRAVASHESRVVIALPHQPPCLTLELGVLARGRASTAAGGTRFEHEDGV